MPKCILPDKGRAPFIVTAWLADLAMQVAIRIDYVFASASLAAKASGCGIWVEADGVSDHRPVWADFELDGEDEKL